MATIVLTPQQVDELHSTGNQTFYLIYHNLYPELCHFMINRCKCDEIDLVVDAFFEFWQRRKDFKTFREIRGFLFTVTINAYKDWLRHQKVEDKYKKYVLSMSTELDEPHLLKDQYALQLEYLKLIYAEIEKLPETEKKIFNLSYFEQLKNSEIASVLSMSERSVKTMKSRALNRLRRSLSDKKLLLAAALIVILAIKIFSKSSLLLTGQDVLLIKRSSELNHLPFQHRDNNKHNH